MICKYYLTLGSEVSDIKSPQCIEVSSMISNIGDVEVSHARVGLGGVVRRIGSSIDFVGEAYDRLVALYDGQQLHSCASFAVYRIDNDWTFSKFFECPLDFSTFHYDGHTASCSCLDSSVAAVIKSKKSVKYEYPVSEMKEMSPLRYDGLRILNDTTFQMIGTEVEGSAVTEMEFDRAVWWWFPRLGATVSNLINNESILVTDQEEFIQKDGTDCGWGFPAADGTASFFAEAVRDCVVSIDFSQFFIKDCSHLGFVLNRITGTTVTPLTCGYSNLLALDSNTKMNAVKWSGKLSAGDKLQYAVFNHDRMFDKGNRKFWIMPNDGMVSWYERSASVDVDVISPLKLLDSILLSMSGDGERIYGGIKDTVLEYVPASSRYVEKDNARLANTMLAASDSVRNVPGAKVKTSFSDFCKFMETVFGYVYEIQWKPKSGGGIPEEIVATSEDFKGFTDLHTNITYIDDPDAVVHYSTTDKNFVGVSYGSSMRDCSHSFPGYERYHTYIEGEGYRVHEDRTYHDTEDDVYYTATAYRHRLPDTGTEVWKSELHEVVIDNVPASDYSGRELFGGIISDYDADAGAYGGTFDSSCVKYARRKKHFVYESGGKFYSSFPGGGSYNLSGRARRDVIFESAGQTYVILGTSLTKCVVVEGGEVVLAPYVYFRHRDELFTSKGTHIVTSVADFEYEVSDRIYSQVQIGYQKQDYDIGNNGADEFNFTNVYTVDQKLSDRKFSLISPYRADCYGFEELAEKRGKETTSTESDGQIFAVYCSTDGKVYTVDRTLAVTGVTTETMFNGQLSPMHCVEANGRYIASFAPSLRFASTEGNSEAVIGGRKLSSDLVLERPLFGHGNITFSSDSYSVPDNWNGYSVEITVMGHAYRGFLESLDLAADESEILKYRLIESK